MILITERDRKRPLSWKPSRAQQRPLGRPQMAQTEWKKEEETTKCTMKG